MCLYCIHNNGKCQKHGSFVPQDRCKRLQEAINNAMPGDTIMAERGVYREPTIVVNKPLYLKGIGYPVLDGQKKNEIMIIKSSRVVVEGFVVQQQRLFGVQ